MVTVVREAELRRVVAEFLEVDTDALAPATELGVRVSSSLARAGLDAALRRRLGIKCAAVYTARRYGELEAAVLGEGGATAVLGAVLDEERESTVLRDGRESTVLDDGRESAALGEAQLAAARGASDEAVGHVDVRCGVDIVEVGELPEAGDYWEHDFYRHSFTPAEIAYCLMQPHPRQHFAARWAAKEAAKKLSPEYFRAELRDLEVGIGTHGQPALKRHGLPLPVALSLSHTSSAAVAVVVSAPVVVAAPIDAFALAAGSAPAAARGRQTVAASDALKRAVLERSVELAEGQAAPIPSARRSSPRFGRLMAWPLWLATSGMAVWALVRTFTFR